MFGLTYSGKTDSTPTPATNLRNLKVVLIPALRLPSTIPFNVNSRRLFSGTCCSLIHRKISARTISEQRWSRNTKKWYTNLIWIIHPGCTSGISLSERTFSTASLFRICIGKQQAAALLFPWWFCYCDRIVDKRCSAVHRGGTHNDRFVVEVCMIRNQIVT